MGSVGKWAKMLVGGAVICIGGPMFVNYIRPSEEELFKRFNPDLQRRNLENRDRRQKEFDDFVTQLKEYSKSDKPIWVVAKEAEELQKKQRREAALAAKKTAEQPEENPAQ
ncbi:Assembly factor cbp4 [Ophidiomyces ophidiicola]|nr:Assembly factor cbp4 [Ophidiomyces ophidiicola]KAI1941158.1 Assembly factor cbp4 [Ophidiomyces ophidiicola]KAI1959054.1 Assembly factor cbp4 [Ophidiomyces ophidiicola]